MSIATVSYMGLVGLGVMHVHCFANLLVSSEHHSFSYIWINPLRRLAAASNNLTIY